MVRKTVRAEPEYVQTEWRPARPEVYASMNHVGVSSTRFIDEPHALNACALDCADKFGMAGQ